MRAAALAVGDDAVAEARMAYALAEAQRGRLDDRFLHACCLPSYREWKPAEFVARLDALLGSDVFARRYRDYAAQPDFPDLRPIYADLGLKPAGDHIELRDDAPSRATRDAIMRTPTASAAGAQR